MSAAVNNYANTGGATTTSATNLPANGRTTASLVLDDRLGHTREVGNQATWSLSSCKPGMKDKYLGCPLTVKYLTQWPDSYKDKHLILLQGLVSNSYGTEHTRHIGNLTDNYPI